MTPEEAWLDLCEVTDRTSPADCPDMCLITFEELRDYMLAAIAGFLSSEVKPVGLEPDLATDALTAQDGPSSSLTADDAAPMGEGNQGFTVSRDHDPTTRSALDGGKT